MTWLWLYHNEGHHLTEMAHTMVTADVRRLAAVMGDEAAEALDAAIMAMRRELGHEPDSPHVRGIVAKHIQSIVDEAQSFTPAPGPAPPKPRRGPGRPRNYPRPDEQIIDVEIVPDGPVPVDFYDCWRSSAPRRAERPRSPAAERERRRQSGLPSRRITHCR